MTGVELAYALRVRLPASRALIISGFADVDFLNASLPRLAKPFVQSELASAPASMLASATPDPR
jgi:hypothetical protein